MKNLLTLGCFITLFCMSCTDKNKTESTTNTLTQTEIQSIEAETQELKSIENDITKDIEELDILLREVDGN